MRVLALASYDSFLNTASLIAPHFEREGCEFEYALVRARANAQITPEQVAGLALGSPVRWITIEDLCGSAEAARYDIILSCLEGLSTRRLVHHLAPLGEKRPLVISVYPGLVLRYPFDGYSMRTASDLVWMNCKSDLLAFQSMCKAFGVDDRGARIFGIAPLLQPIERDAAAEDGPVVFFEQAIIPRYHDERLFLAEQFVLLAKRHPQIDFIVKPRTMGKDATLHRTWHAIEPLMHEAAERQGGWPANLSLSSEKASALLARASHCLTVSSTVATEAIHAGVPTTIIGDFGAHDEYGLSYFFGSGLIRNFSDMVLPSALEPNPDWLSLYMANPKETISELVQEAIRMAAEPRQSMAERSLRAEISPELRAYLTARNGAAGVLSRSYQSKRRGWLSQLLSKIGVKI